MPMIIFPVNMIISFHRNMIDFIIRMLSISVNACLITSDMFVYFNPKIHCHNWFKML
jgi:hypothetical protein